MGQAISTGFLLTNHKQGNAVYSWLSEAEGNGIAPEVDVQGCYIISRGLAPHNKDASRNTLHMTLFFLLEFCFRFGLEHCFRFGFWFSRFLMKILGLKCCGKTSDSLRVKNYVSEPLNQLKQFVKFYEV